jgi:tetratricopeptide (TPR) repeat protein
MAEILRLFFVMMSEMLGNQYFLARNYASAAENLQYALNNDALSKPIRKKLIICYSQIGEIQKALNIFYNLIIEDIDCIINTDSISDDCPCPELVTHYGTILPYEENSTDLKVMLGMIWLYCDTNKSLSFFKTVENIKPEDNRIKSITEILENKLSLINNQNKHS